MAEEKTTVLIDVQVDAENVAQELSAAIKAMSDLKTEQKALTKEIQAGNDADGEKAKRLAEVNNAIENNSRTIKANTALLQAATKEGLKQGASLDEQRQYLGQLQKAYGALSGAAKEAADEQGGLRDKIKDLSDSVKEQEAALGDNRRNVGNYSEALQGLEKEVGGISGSLKDLTSGSLAGAAKGVQGLSDTIKAGAIPALKSFAKVLLTTPLGWIAAAIAAVVAVLGKLRDALKKNDDAGTAFAKLFASFQPIIDGVSKALDTVVGWLGKAADALADFIGRIGGGVKEAQDLVTAMDNLEEAERQYVVNSAERNRDIADLRAKSVEADKYSVEERKKFLEDAIALQEQDLKEQKEIAEERLRILEKTAEKESDTSDETKNKIAEARAAVINAEANYSNRKKELAAQVVAFDKQIQDADAQRTAQLQEQIKQRETLRAKEVETTRNLSRQLQDAIIQNMQDADAQELVQTRVQYDRQIEDLQRRLDTEKDLTLAQRDILRDLIIQAEIARDNALAEIEKKQTEERAAKLKEQQDKALQDLRDFQQQLKEVEAEAEDEEDEDVPTVEELAARLGLTQEAVDYYCDLLRQGKSATEAYDLAAQKSAQDTTKAFATMAGNMSSAFSTMSDLFAQYGEDSEAASKASKSFAVGALVAQQAEAIGNTAISISNAVAGATAAAAAGGPAAPFLIAAYIASMVGSVVGAVAGVVSSIQQARELLNSDTSAGKFATGGIVGGTSYSGDRLTAQVNSREAIMTLPQQQRLLDIADGNAIPSGGIDYETMAAAMAAAVQQLPAPTMVYSEFRDFETQVAGYTDIAKV